MRTLIDVKDHQIRALDALARRHKQSRAALIRVAIDDFLAKSRHGGSADAFGLWGDQKIDGLAYQEQVRREW